MSLTNEQIIEAIASKSVTEIVELIAAMEEKFGVSAAAVAAAPVESIMAVMLLLNDSALESRMFAAFAPSEEENISDRDFPVD